MRKLAYPFICLTLLIVAMCEGQTSYYQGHPYVPEAPNRAFLPDTTRQVHRFSYDENRFIYKDELTARDTATYTGTLENRMKNEPGDVVEALERRVRVIDENDSTLFILKLPTKNGKNRTPHRY